MSAQTLARHRNIYAHGFAELERDVNDLVGRVAGSSREHQSLGQRIAGHVTAFNDFTELPLTQESARPPACR